MKASGTPSHTSPGAEGWKYVLQLLKEQSAKMEKRGGNPEEAGIPPRLKKDGYLPETALCVSGRYPKKADKGGEKGWSFSLRRVGRMPAGGVGARHTWPRSARLPLGA